ncbi:hypothetical protein B5X24_HaOG208260 [Helicoverpa armigera]|uniref:Uncharacterized protein n=1 Tax=Helicoverpa armigera TaxID=29058 RepID=A0A2W1BH19_HELAM|nr:hypothetical protein B5X24_HaOG208260 [Helicoverpa armigera]
MLIYNTNIDRAGSRTRGSLFGNSTYLSGEIIPLLKLIFFFFFLAFIPSCDGVRFPYLLLSLRSILDNFLFEFADFHVFLYDTNHFSFEEKY